MTRAAPNGVETPGARFARSVVGELRRHLIIPVMPTPNGRLHLGHIAGPFLKCDVLARHLRRCEREAWIVSGSDVYESYVMLKSSQTGEPPTDVARLNHHLIDRDLHSLDIIYDEWIFPLHPRWKDLHDRTQLDVLDHFEKAGKAYQRWERVQYDPFNNRFAVGCWLLGRCPVCGTNAGSYFCEACGAHFRPEEIRDPRSRDGITTVEATVSSLFLRLSNPDALREAIACLRLPADFMQAADGYLRRQTDVRLTNPGRWGVAWPAGDGDLSHVVFTYTGLFAFSLVCGSVYQQLASDPVHPFNSDSDVVTVTTFGLDNSVPYLVGVLGCALEHETYRPFDHYLVNYFLNLEGQKFSTSRNHVIWASDVVSRTSLSSDLVRMFLALISPEDGVSNLDIDALVFFANEGFGRMLHETLASASQQLSPAAVGFPPPALADAFTKTLQAQVGALSPADFSLRRAAITVEDWLKQGMLYCDTPAGAFWWLKSFALLASPLMPRLSESVWQELGHSIPLTMTAFLDHPAPHRSVVNYKHVPTSRGEILAVIAD
jgi:methionyl-tRNA synthetase